MAASGFTPLQLYYSSTAAATPTSGNLVSGELAINITDGKLYYKDNAGVVQLLASKTTAGGVATNLSGGGTGTVVFQSSAGNTSYLTLGTSGQVLVAGASAPQYVAQSSLSVGSATTATNITGGAAGSLVYQTGSGATTTLALGTTGHFLVAGASAPQYASPTSITVGNANALQNTGSVTTNSTFFITFVDNNTTSYQASKTSASLGLNPSTGTLIVGLTAPLGGATNPIVAMSGTANSYVQSYIRNASTGTSASADFAAYADNSSDASGWIDMGYTSSTYSDASFPITGQNEGYIFMSAPSGAGKTGNLVYATDATGSENSHQWYVGGFSQAKGAWKMQLATSGLQTTSFGVGTAASGTAGEIRATNNVTAYYSSDRKLKENIKDVENPLAIVSAIGAKTFDWTNEYIAAHGGEDGYFVQKSDFGVIAQDVQKVFPLAVRTREDGTLAVDYEKLATLAFGAIKELVKRVEALEAK